MYQDEQKWPARRCLAKHYGDRCFMQEHPASDTHAAWLNGLQYVTWTQEVKTYDVLLSEL